MKNSIIYITTIAILTSCTWKNEISFEIENTTKFQIDSLKIEANKNSHEKYISLKPHESKEYIFDMSEVIKVDGSYNLSYIIKGIKKDYNFGYYTNGAPSERLIELKIHRDSVTNKVLKH